jgi:hypothetical protein
MESEMDLLGKRFTRGVFEKGDGLLQAVDEEKAGMAVLHVFFQIFANLGIQFSIDIFGEFLQDLFAFHSFTLKTLGFFAFVIFGHT